MDSSRGHQSSQTAHDAPVKDWEYDLKIDAQAEEFIKLKQQLTYFIVTGSVVVIAFTVNFAVDQDLSGGELGFLIAMAATGLFAAGCALGNLYLELKSYQLHVDYRYKRKSWPDLTQEEQDDWNKLTDPAKRLIRASFLLFGAEIALAAIYFIIELG